MKITVAFAILAFAWAQDDLENLGDLPIQNPDLFQGDIMGIDVEDRNVIPDKQKRWTNRVLIYEIDPSLDRFTNAIALGMEHYEENTCLKFKKRTDEPNYVRMFYGNGCYSYVGMTGGPQPLSLGDGCIYLGLIVHELGHAIGLFHEQNRSDRDDYLTIFWDNIQPGLEHAFFLLKPHENLLLEPFDHDSIMLYGNTAFSKDGVSKTMVAKNGVELIETYKKYGLSDSDIRRINAMYGC